jgi:hypothetical protein
MVSLPDEPLTSLSRFAAALGWHDLKAYQHRYLDGDTLVTTTWYESDTAEGRRSDFFLQINHAPCADADAFVGAVYAMRYGICTGWHRFTLHTDPQLSLAEAGKIESWLHRRLFETLPMRRDFRQSHPECGGYSWRRIREQGPPYSQDGRVTA